MLKNRIIDKVFSSVEIKTYRMIYRAIFLILGFFSVFCMSILIQENKYKLALIPGICALICSLLEFVFGEMIVEKSYPSETKRILRAVDNMSEQVSESLINCIKNIIDNLTGCDKSLVQATIHLRIDVNKTKDDNSRVFGLLQILPYYHLGMTHEDYINSKDKRGRMLQSYKGIIGRCLRTENVECVTFSTVEEYNYRMINDFGFTKNEIKNHTFSARSYFAAPFKSQEQLIGMIYLFSKEPQVFPKAIEMAKFYKEASHVLDILKIGKIINTNANIVYK